MKKRTDRHQRRKIRHAPPGTSPGVVHIPEDAFPLKAVCLMYDGDVITEKHIRHVSEMTHVLRDFPSHTFWFDLKGFGDREFLLQLSDHFKIHRLQMEDVVNVYQRPKVEEYKEHLFIISRMIFDQEEQLQNDQLSIFLGNNFVITIQEKYEDKLDPVRNRLKQGKGNIRVSGPDYLAYSLIDVALDNYFPVLERIGERLDDIQDELIANPRRELLQRILQLKRELITLRRSAWSERDKINDILRSNFPQIRDSAKVFFRDTYDHCIQIIDLVESYKELIASLMDVYQSSVSNRLNQVMKVLTIISTIFIPLTFIVGIYGMNFSYTDPDTGQRLPLNMPELYQPYGYITVWGVMVLMVVLQLIFFYRKGWLTKN